MPQALVPGGKGQGHQSCHHPSLDLAVIRPALQMGNGWARGDIATESPVTSGRERRTPRPNRPIGREYARWLRTSCSR